VGSQKNDFLRDLPGFSSGRLTLHSANISEPGALDEILRGCHALIHAAADPDIPLERRPQEYGSSSQHIIDSVNRTSSISRVIYVSSAAAIMGDTDVYGVKVPKNAAKDSKMFMNMQIGWCGCGFCGKIITFILTLVVHFKMEAIGNKMEMGGTPKDANSAVSMLKQAHFHSMWISEATSMIVYIIIGLTFLYCARKMLSDQNVNCFCCFEGCCSAMMCCSGCMACIYFGMLVVLAGALSDPTYICTHANTTFNSTELANFSAAFAPITNTSIAFSNSTAPAPFPSA